MNIGVIGLGKMGCNLAQNLLDQSNNIIGYDISETMRNRAKKMNINVVENLEDIIGGLTKPYTLILMIPAGPPVDKILAELKKYLGEGDIIIDAGNSHYKDTVRRYENLLLENIHLVDIGTSGGVSGARNGICAMVGGDDYSMSIIEETIKGISCVNGYYHAGMTGSGHYLKMVHNAIEYGMMQSIAEGFEMLDKSQFNFDYEKVALLWNSGSVIRSWLMELLIEGFKTNDFDLMTGYMHSSGEGKWAAIEALEMEMSAPVITLSLLNRYRSKEKDTFTGKIVSVLRNQFGGHEIYRDNPET